MTANKTYTHVIVGAGSAGCVLANRLSADPNADILLLEAGDPDDRSEIHVPMSWWGLPGSDVDWGYRTTPQRGLNGRVDNWPRGKTLGGSSAINAMMYIRGHPWDFDRWAHLGNDGWAYDDLLPFFIRAEDFEGGESTHHGVDGPLRITRPDSKIPASRALVTAAEEVGFPYNDDFNAGEQAGVGPLHLTAAGEQRQSTAISYLHPVIDRDNLSTVTSAHVTRIHIDGARAVGLTYERHGVQHAVEVTGEIILSAGAIESPKLLLVSGIGPRTHLDGHDIECVLDLPGVGRNLQDHIQAGIVSACTEDVTYPARSNGNENSAFERTEPDLPAPDIQYLLWPTQAGDEPTRLIITAVLLRPRSRGRITLRSANPFDPPIIDPKYFADSRDLDTILTGIERAQEIMAASALDPYRGDPIRPDPSIRSTEGLAEYVRQHASTLYHPVGTCKMGDDALAVVDDQLRVHGIDALRIVDASIMPRITSGNTNAPTIAIAERAADLVLDSV